VVSVSPSKGSAAGSTSMLIRGSGFVEGINITVAGAGCSEVNIVSSSVARCTTTRSRAQKDADVVVVDPQHLQSWTAYGTYTAQAPTPKVESVSPNKGPDYGGTQIVVSGKKFAAGARVTVGDKACDVTSVAAEEITCTTGPHLAGAVTLTVMNADGMSGEKADAFTYVSAQRLLWVNLDNPSIAASGLDGSDPNNYLISSDDVGADGFGPNDVAANADYVYWTDLDTGSIGRADRDGGNVQQQFISGLDLPWHVTVTDTHIYWSDWRTEAIGRAALDGTDVAPVFVADVGEAVGLAASDSYLYWGNAEGNGSIGRVGLDGSGSDPDFISNGVGSVSSVTVDATHIYWTDESTKFVRRIALAGTGEPEPVVKTGSGVDGIAVDDTHVYWANTIGGSIGRATLAGGEVNQGFIGGVAGPMGVTLG
jgi:virginiamycin B lyase